VGVSNENRADHWVCVCCCSDNVKQLEAQSKVPFAWSDIDTDQRVVAISIENAQQPTTVSEAIGDDDAQIKRIIPTQVLLDQLGTLPPVKLRV
jgi:hypothetical protein